MHAYHYAMNVDLFHFPLSWVYTHMLCCWIDFSVFLVIAAFGVDAAFSYKYNQQLGICNNNGLVICSGFNTMHVIPVCYRLLILLIKLIMT